MRSQSSAPGAALGVRRARGVRGRERGGVRAGAAVLCALILLLTAASGATAAPRSTAAPRATPASGASTAAYIAARLRENPVYVTDQLPRTNPRSTAREFAAQAKRTGVPTYAIVLPTGAARTGQRGLLAAVHDRLGKKGLYVLVTGNGGSVLTATYGVDVPAEDAATATQFELPFDAGLLLSFTRFVDVLTSGDAPARARAGLDRAESGDQLDPLYADRSQREDESFTTGLVLSGVPVLILAVGWYARRRRGHGPGVALYAPVAALVAGVVVFGAPLVYDETRGDGDPLPTAADMSARTDRVAAGLRKDPLYADPESAVDLTARQRATLRAHLARLDVPVRIAAVPTSSDDESAGDGELLAETLHKKTGKDGVYVVAEPRGSGMDIVNYGAKVDSAELYNDNEDLRYGPGGSDGPGLYEQLDKLLNRIDRMPARSPGHPYLPPPPAVDPVKEDELPPLYSEETTGGAVLGALGAAGVFAVLVAGLGVVRYVRRGRAENAARVRQLVVGPAAGSAAGARRTPEAPAKPSLGWLRRTARAELGELNETFGRETENLAPQVRTRAWECLDAATLLLDQEGDLRIDDDVAEPELAVALALLRAGSAAIRDSDGPGHVPAHARGEGRLCAVNPLHGPATSRKKFIRPGEGAGTGAATGGRGRSHQVCDACRNALSAPALSRPAALAAAVDERMLRLPAPASREDGPRGHRPGGVRRGGTERALYDQVPGPFSHFEGGAVPVAPLISRVREQLGVH